MPRASIIICTRNRSDSLRRTLAAIAGVTIPAGMSAEVIVVDNGSSDDTEAVVLQARLENPAVKYVVEPEPGQCRARNRGIAEATGDIVIFTDDDVIPVPDWLAMLCAPILAGTADAAVGCVQLAPHLITPWMAATHCDWLADTSRLDPRDPSRMVGANMAFSRSVLDRVPAFDIELGPGGLGFGDDTLFSRQLKAAGYRIALASQAVVEHHFLKDRLAPGEWIKSAGKLGRTDAYISHHWDHAVWPHPRRQAAVSFLRLAFHRLLAGKAALVKSEPFLQHVRSFHAALQYLRERKRPRNYEKHGLVKLPPQAVSLTPVHTPVHHPVTLA
jgi:glycosyltransferase involved in cell wall biosynthesis